jgi:hypothetical protein
LVDCPDLLMVSVAFLSSATKAPNPSPHGIHLHFLRSVTPEHLIWHPAGLAGVVVSGLGCADLETKRLVTSDSFDHEFVYTHV